jgi:hypothetical protein
MTENRANRKPQYIDNLPEILCCHGGKEVHVILRIVMPRGLPENRQNVRETLVSLHIHSASEHT